VSKFEESLNFEDSLTIEDSEPKNDFEAGLSFEDSLTIDTEPTAEERAISDQEHRDAARERTAKMAEAQGLDDRLTVSKIAFGEGEDYENPEAPSYNVAKGLVERGNELVVNTLEGAQSIVDYSQKQFGTGNTKMFKKAAEWAKGTMGYKPTHTEEGITEAFEKGGLLDIDTIQEGLLYGYEQGIKSIPDMGAMVTQLPLYIFSRTKEMADDRAKNSGRKEGDLEDMAIAAPFVLGSVWLDRLGLKAMTSDVVNNIGKDIIEKGWKAGTETVLKAVGAATVKEAGTEAVQEGLIEATGEAIGTDKELDPGEMFKRGAFAALAGGVMGGGMATATATGAELYQGYTENKQAAVRSQALRKRALSFTFTSLTPDQQKLKAQLSGMNFTSLNEEQQKIKAGLENMVFDSLTPEQREEYQAEEQRITGIQQSFSALVKDNGDVTFPTEVMEDIDLQERILKEYENLEAGAEEALGEKEPTYAEIVQEEKKQKAEEAVALEEVGDFFEEESKKQFIPKVSSQQKAARERAGEKRELAEKLFPDGDEDKINAYMKVPDKKKVLPTEEQTYAGMSKEDLEATDEQTQIFENELSEIEEPATVEPEGLNESEQYELSQLEEKPEGELTQDEEWRLEDLQAKQTETKETEQVPDTVPEAKEDAAPKKDETLSWIKEAKELASRPVKDQAEYDREATTISNLLETHKKSPTPALWEAIERRTKRLEEFKDKPTPIIVDEILSPQLEADKIVDDYAATQKKIGYKKDLKREGYQEVLVIGDASGKVGHITIELEGGMRRDVKVNTLTHIKDATIGEEKGSQDEYERKRGEQPKKPILRDGGDTVSETSEGEAYSRLDDGRVEDTTTAGHPKQAADSRSQRDSDLTSYSGSVEDNPFILEQLEAVASGEISRYNDNTKAIRLLKENKSRYTLEEKKTLSRYTGWGGLQKAFEQPKGGYAKGWEERATKLRQSLTPEEYKEARSGVLDAYYTPIETVKAMWDISEHLGFNGGMVLEPSMGTGRFIGLTPDKFKSNTAFNGVELDPTTYKIATALYKVNGRNKGFQETEYKDVHELILGNPPYAKQIKIVDKNNKALSGLTIHDYFVAKSIDSLKDGGILNFVITSSFLDSMTNKAKFEINKRAKLIGAIRLPNNVFASAGTKVTTDIVIFQKLQDGEKGNLEEWGETGLLNEAKINKYFINNPDMLLGEWRKGYRGGELIATDGDISTKIAQVKAKLPASIMNKADNITKQADISGADDTMPASVIYEKDGEYYVNIKTGEALEPQLIKGKRERVMDFIKVRDLTNKVIDMQLDTSITEKELEKNRTALNAAYNHFFRRHGYLNNTANRNIVVQDKSGYTVLGLEENYQRKISDKQAKQRDTAPQEESGEKADILTKRTIKPLTEVKTENTSEALLLSVYRKGIVDIPYIIEVTGKTKEIVIKDLKGKIFKDNKQGYVTKDVFLSGDVKTKLEETIDEDARKELLKVIPIDKEAHEITADIGASWISPQIHEQYMKEKLGFRYPKLGYNRVTSKWSVPTSNHSYDFPFSGGAGDTEILSSALNNKKIIIRRSETVGGVKRSYVDEEATTLANAKVEELREDFANWIFSKESRRNELVPLYNDLYNRYNQMDHEGKAEEYKIPNLKFFEPRQHQTKAVYRAVFGNSPLLLNHTVGSGKTLTSQMIAMEWRRLGKANKPLIIALKSTVEQFTREFKEAYPNAKVLLPNDNDFNTANRKRFLSSIATGDYDAIVLSHEQLTKLQNPYELQKQLIEDEIAQAEEALLDAKEEDDRFTVRDLETAIEKLEARYEKLTTGAKDTDILSFEKLGIDGMIVDESHQFKKLAYATSMGSIKGMPSTDGSLRAFDLYVKTKAILKKNNNLVFMTGTPITNTLPELFLIQKYLQEDTLAEQGLNQFDAWAKNYADPTTDIEMTPTGGFKEVTRMKSFKNIPMLMETAGQIIDTVTNADIKKSDPNFKLPELEGGKPKTIFIEPSKSQLDFTKTLIDRLATVSQKDNPDNHLAIFGDAVKMAMDMRLISPTYADESTSKVNSVVFEALKKHKQFAKERGTQLIFSDIGTPKGRGKAKAKLEELITSAESGDTEAQKTLANEWTDAEIQDILTGSKFSIYEDIRSKLIKGGVPAKEIAFIHDYGTKQKKAELSEKVNSGEIRFVLGSTKKLGTGMNVQKKLTAVHHIDIPYTPAELEQRNGRIIRQGNTILAANPDFKIDIFYYATKKTLDGVKWQILENKAKFIQDFMSGVASEVDIEEESNSELAERMKAEASGNPFLIDKIKADKKVKKLEAMKRGYETNQAVQRSKLQQFEFEEKTLPETIDNYSKDIEQIKTNEVKINKKTFEKPGELGEAIYKILDKYVQAKGLKPKVIGSVGNIEISIAHDQDMGISTIFLNGEVERKLILDFFKQKPSGIGTRLLNELQRYEVVQEKIKEDLQEAKESIIGVNKQLSQEFSKWDEYKAAKTEQAEAISNIEAEVKKEDQAPDTEDVTTPMRPGFATLDLLSPFTYTGAINTAKNKLDNIVFQNVTGKIKGTKFDTFLRKYGGTSMAGLGSLTREQETDFVRHFRRLQAKLAKADVSAKDKAQLIEDSRGQLSDDLFNTLSIRYLENPEAREAISEEYPELAEHLDIVREYIDRISLEAMEKGIILPSQYAKWEGRYLSRLYLSIQKPDIAAKVSSGIKMYENKKNRKIESIIDYLEEFPEEAERLGAILDPSMMIKMTIAKTQGNIGIEEFFRGITERSHIIDTDMLVALSDRVANLPMMFSPIYAEKTALPYIEDMINRLDENMDADEITFLIERKEEIEDQIEGAKDAIINSVEGLAEIPDDKRYGAIAGVKMTADAASLVKSQFNVVNNPVMMKEKIDNIGKKFLVYFKWAKVPANIFAYPRNFQSNFFQWGMSGADPTQFFTRYASAARSMRKQDRWYRMAVESGVLHTNMITMEVNDALRSISEELSDEHVVKKWILKKMEQIGDLYGVIDDVAKIARMRYAMEIERMSEEEAVEKAQDTHYDYALTYDLIRGMRDPDMTKAAWLKLIGTLFPTYTHKTIAYVYDTIINRPVTLAMISAALVMLVNGATDDDRDEIGHKRYDKIMNDIPEWMADNPLIRVDMEKRGRDIDVTFTDISYVVPFGSLLSALYSTAKGDPIKGASNIGLAGTPVHIIGGFLTNRDAFSGKEIYYEHDDLEKYKDSAKYIAKQLAPGTLTKIYSLKETRHPELPRWVGINTYVYTAKELASWKEWAAKQAKLDAGKRILKFKRKVSQARKDMKQGKISAKEYYEIRKDNLEEIKRWRKIGEDAYKRKKNN